MVWQWEPGTRYDNGCVVEYEGKRFAITYRSIFLFRSVDLTQTIFVCRTSVQDHSTPSISGRYPMLSITFIVIRFTYNGLVISAVRLDSSRVSGSVGTLPRGPSARPRTPTPKGMVARDTCIPTSRWFLGSAP
jgi:hypothetical protein